MNGADDTPHLQLHVLPQASIINIGVINVRKSGFNVEGGLAADTNLCSDSPAESLQVGND